MSNAVTAPPVPLMTPAPRGTKVAPFRPRVKSAGPSRAAGCAPRATFDQRTIAGGQLFVEQFYRKIKATAARGRVSMITMRSIGTALVISLAVIAPLAYSQDDAHEDLAPCPGSAPEPTQSAAWSV